MAFSATSEDAPPAGTTGAASASAGGGGGLGGLVKGLLPKYFSSEWSFAQFRLSSEIRTIVAFGHEENTVLVVGSDGSFLKANYEKGGEAVRVFYSQFLTKTYGAEVY